MDLIPQIIWIGGAVIVVLVAVQGLFFVFGNLRAATHQHQQRRRELALWDTRLETARLRQRQAARQQQWAWTGFRKFQVVRKEAESADRSIVSFYLRPHDQKPIPGFVPGQFLTFRLPLPDEPKPLVRCYSLSGAPSLDAEQPDYRVSIKRVPANPKDSDSRPGRCSNYFHDAVEVGDLLDVKPPSGHFVLDMEKDTPVVLIGGGVGLTPMMSMLAAVVAHNPQREVWFFYGVRHRDEHAMLPQMRELAASPNVHLQVCYSDPREADVAGRDYDHAERISVDLFRRVLPSNNYEFYMCGPGPMMDALTAGLAEWGVPDSDVHLEAFGPSAPKKKAKTADPAAAGPPVTFRKSEVTAAWDPSLEHLWEFAQANDVSIESGCLQGNCGSCETAVLKGKVVYPEGPPSFEPQAGNCLPCCAKPDGPLELDA